MMTNHGRCALQAEEKAPGEVVCTHPPTFEQRIRLRHAQVPIGNKCELCGTELRHFAIKCIWCRQVCCANCRDRLRAGTFFA